MELIHAYSLVHDDLPCMDDDVLRRGKPTCHVAYGEAMALLAGDALQTLAFEILAEAPRNRAQADMPAPLALLAAAAGSRGMAGGQAIDLCNVGAALTLDELEQMHALKTGALIQAAVLLGAACGRALECARKTTRSIVMRRRSGSASRSSTTCSTSKGPPQSLGKTAGKDAMQGKADLRLAAGPRRGQGARRRVARRGAHCAARLRRRARAGSTSSPTGSRCAQELMLLDTIDSPADLRRLDKRQLAQLARELRDFIIKSVSQTGGHLSSNLGTVELTVALHYVFDTPHDRIVWDVGHQTYAHKILTGRREGMAKLRNGAASPVSRAATKATTTPSAPRIRRRRSRPRSAWRSPRSSKGEDRRVVAVIGDGAMSAGMAFEALNNAGALGTDLLVILNDNDMSISEPVGALNNYLARLLSGRVYNYVRRGGKEVLSKLPPVKDLAKRWEEHMKGMVLPGTLVRGIRLQLHRADRRPRSRRAGEDAGQRQGIARARNCCT